MSRKEGTNKKTPVLRPNQFAASFRVYLRAVSGAKTQGHLSLRLTEKGVATNLERSEATNPALPVVSRSGAKKQKGASARARVRNEATNPALPVVSRSGAKKQKGARICGERRCNLKLENPQWRICKLEVCRDEVTDAAFRWRMRTSVT